MLDSEQAVRCAQALAVERIKRVSAIDAKAWLGRRLCFAESALPYLLHTLIGDMRHLRLAEQELAAESLGAGFWRFGDATGIGEARNALVARAAFALVAVGDSYGTLSEVALGLQFGRPVLGLCGAARVAGVTHLETAAAAIDAVAAIALALPVASARS